MIITRPSLSVVAVAPTRAVDRAPAADQVLVVGLNISAEDRAGDALRPPATRTRPSGSSAEACSQRAVAILPTALHASVEAE